jgi:hypothetical protein
MIKNQCLPKIHELMTYIINNYNYSELRLKFCENTSYEFLNETSAANCKKACVQELYEILYSSNFGPKIKFIQRLSSHYIAIEHNPQMKFDQFLMNFGGLLGLWHGLSLIDLKNYLIKLINVIYSKYHEMRRFFLWFTNLKMFKIFKKLFKKKVGTNFILN